MAYLLAFFFMLAAFLLITIAAVARTLWRRLRPIGTSHIALERPPLKSSDFRPSIASWRSNGLVQRVFRLDRATDDLSPVC
jgi:hypothetical protein